MGDIRVLVVDAQRLFAQAVSAALAEEPGITVVWEFPPTGTEAVDVAIEHAVDVAVVDFWMPGLDGPDVARRIVASRPEARVLILSWIHSQANVQRSLDAGAAGYLPKNLSLEHLVGAIRLAHEGAGLVFGEQLGDLVDDLARRLERSAAEHEKVESLTPREFEVLRAMAEGRRPDEVAGALGITVGTVKKHLQNVIRRTGAPSLQAAIDMAGRDGRLVLPGAHDQ